LIISYDLLNRLTLTESKKGGSVLFSAAYTLDSAGMRTRVVESLAGSSRTVNYTYDGLYRLLSESDGSSSTSYTYSPTGNRLTKTSGAVTASYVYDADDRLLSDGSSTFTYDSNGNKKTETKAGVTTTYTWDAENRLRATQGGGVSTVYDYDYAGTRVSQSVNGVETRFLVDKNRSYAQVLEEYGSNGAIQAAYVYGNDLISQDRNGTKSFYIYDGLGSTRALTDVTGNVTDSYSYDAYGNLSSSSGSTVNSYLYAGEQFDKNLGDYYLRDRYYSTDIGRFTQRDRFDGDMMNPLSLNHYGYTHGNPVNGIDPSGMFLLFASQKAEDEVEKLHALDFQRVAGTQQNIIRILDVPARPEFRTMLTIGGTIALGVGFKLLEIAVLYQVLEEVSTFIRQFSIPVYLPGNDIPQTTQHIYDAITGSGGTKSSGGKAPFFLQRTERYTGKWYDNEPPCYKWNGNPNTIPPGYQKWIRDWQVCDEFPFATTKQGGYPKYLENKVSLRPVPNWEQSAMNGSNGQGDQINKFYSRSGIVSNDLLLGSYFTFPLFGDSSSFIDRSGSRRYFYTV
jgi:RHS repeat-associated protein